MKYIAIDYGTKRTGLAASDTGGNMAFPRQTLALKTRDRFFAELLDFIEKEEPVAIVVGLPKSIDGEETLMSRQVRNFIARLRRRSDLPIYIIEEALSSFEAELELRDAGLKGHEVAKVVDQQAAVRILESFLNLPEEHRKLYD